MHLKHIDAARHHRTHHTTRSPSHPAPEIALRSFADADREALLRLYHDGLLSTEVVPQDPAVTANFLIDRYTLRSQDHLWVAESHGQVIASIGITEEKGVGHVRRLRVDHSWIEWHDGDLIRMLIALAADHAREHGMLKLVLHTALHDERAIAFLHQIGFEFARIRDRQGRHLLEFYLNIYQRSDPHDDAPA